MEKFVTEELDYNEFFNIPDNVKPFEPKPEGTEVEKPEIACNPFKCVIFPISTHIQHIQDDFTTPVLKVVESEGVEEKPEVPDESEDGIKNDGPVKVNMTKVGEEKVGEIVTTKVSLDPGEYAGKMVKVRVTIVPAGANKPKYKEGDKWLDLPQVSEGDGTKDVFTFGGSAGFPLTAGAETEFSNELMKAGKVTTTLEVIDVETDEVISTATQTVTVKE